MIRPKTTWLAGKPGRFLDRASSRSLWLHPRRSEPLNLLHTQSSISSILFDNLVEVYIAGLLMKYWRYTLSYRRRSFMDHRLPFLFPQSQIFPICTYSLKLVTRWIYSYNTNSGRPNPDARPRRLELRALRGKHQEYWIFLFRSYLSFEFRTGFRIERK